MRAVKSLLALLLVAGCATSTSTSRLETLALMQTINGEILAATSATRVLESWCAEHHLAAEAKVVAERVAGAQKTPSAGTLERLGVHDASDVQYRRVQLRCGAHVLSIADNWYVPSRLTPEMNAQLTTTDTPFGKVVQSLHPYRRTFDATMLWSPLPRGWEMQPHLRAQTGALTIPAELFRHRAVLYTSEHVPFAEVVETYQSGLLDFRN